MKRPAKHPAKKSLRNTFDSRADFLVPFTVHSRRRDDVMRPPDPGGKSTMNFSVDDRVFQCGDSLVKIPAVRLRGFKIRSDARFDPGSPHGVRVETVRDGLVTVDIDLGFDLKDLMERLCRELRDLKKENPSSFPRPPRSEMDARSMWKVYELRRQGKKGPQIQRELGLTKDEVRNWFNTARKLIKEVAP